MKQKILSNLFTYILIFTLITCSIQAAQSTVNLGTAGNFAILSKSGISTTGTTSITGNIGVSPIDSTAITGFGLIMDSTNQFSRSSLVTGKIYAADYTDPTPSIMTTAIGDMEIAYTDSAGRTLPDYTELGAGDISGMTLTPGLYKWGTGVHIDNRGVTLSGNSNDIWIFQIAQDLTVDSAAIVTLSGGAKADNIFWQVAGGTGVSLGTTSVFNGNILAVKGIVISTGAVLNGRALAQTAVTLDANSISSPVSEQSVLTTILISPNLTSVIIGSTQQLNVTSFDQFGLPMDAIISFDSNNSGVATIAKETDSKGIVTALASGSVTITAVSGNISGTSIINVETIAPTLDPIGSRSITQGMPINFTITGTSLYGFNLTFTAIGKPITSSFIDYTNGSAMFSWTPISSEVGVTNINFTVSDGIKSASEVVAITVNQFQAPTTISINLGEIWKNNDYNITLNATGFNNTSIDYINYSLNNIPGKINGNFGELLINLSGNNTLKFYAVDTLGNVETSNTIYALLDKIIPNITSFTLSSTSVNVGTGITGTCTATDNLYVGITGVITGIDTTSAGTKTATCTATDLAGNVIISSITYTVNAVSSGGGSGGGGGSYTPEVNKTIIVETPIVLEEQALTGYNNIPGENNAVNEQSNVTKSNSGLIGMTGAAIGKLKSPTGIVVAILIILGIGAIILLIIRKFYK